MKTEPNHKADPNFGWEQAGMPNPGMPNAAPKCRTPGCRTHRAGMPNGVNALSRNAELTGPQCRIQLMISKCYS